MFDEISNDLSEQSEQVEEQGGRTTGVEFPELDSGF